MIWCSECVCQRDEESCPAPAYTCTCSSDIPGSPGSTGPPVWHHEISSLWLLPCAVVVRYQDDIVFCFVFSPRGNQVLVVRKVRREIQVKRWAGNPDLAAPWLLFSARVSQNRVFMLLLCLSGRGRSSGKAWARGRTWTAGQPGAPGHDHTGQSGGKLSVIYECRHSASRCLSAFSSCLEFWTCFLVLPWRVHLVPEERRELRGDQDNRWSHINKGLQEKIWQI